MLGSKANIEGTGLEILDAPQGPRSFDQFQPPQYPVIHHSPQETSEEVLQAREDLMKAIQTFLRKFSRFYLLVKCQELMSKLLEDVRNINEELSEFINSLNWNRPTFYNDDDDEDEILRELFINVNLLVDKIEELKLTPSIPFVLENPSPSPIPVVDSDFLVEEVDTFLVLEDSIPPCIESDLDSEGDIVFLDDLLYEDPIPEYERFTFDIEPDAPVDKLF
ncbi:hypothetical protein Tco_0861241 [Tanacetum coccineum]|uniref:Reverse transcriptase domain-containing protein n=1 Tax=Tanacetum coccineum TaxID=301880 RepID=A0ABQ5BMW9_9ASTR